MSTSREKIIIVIFIFIFVISHILHHFKMASTTNNLLDKCKNNNNECNHISLYSM